MRTTPTMLLLSSFLFAVIFALPATTHVARPNVQMDATQIIANIKLPSTPTIKKALKFARANMNDHTYNHVLRSWLTAQASLSHLPTSVQDGVDTEVLAVSAILHDLGWSNNSALISPTTRFEVNGADVAREFLKREGKGNWSERRIQLVWDAIALHTTRDINLYKEREVWLTSVGIVAELVGPEVAIETYGGERVAVKQEEWDGIAAVFPRKGLRDFFNGVMIGLCASKPDTTYQNFVGDYGDRYLANYSTEGKKTIDFLNANMLE
ncbi:hypothetical protein K505DRAFT_326002 [Melanomma pulvis-pyrius CBS 109.77]|uniref:HD domain-containing protein n=1 Tax=Melanomma pulvis-pyrius CBS 109.77 TaxID=1314802 RepID=A0A6A6X9R3_9PLEO|nr:hypothetical protein K505DRAFT_326002 [Melanomma pulvis-pyrius CBS 109.77]